MQESMVKNLRVGPWGGNEIQVVPIRKKVGDFANFVRIKLFCRKLHCFENFLMFGKIIDVAPPWGILIKLALLRIEIEEQMGQNPAGYEPMTSQLWEEHSTTMLQTNIVPQEAMLSP